MPNRVYDDQRNKGYTPSDDDLRQITGIGPDEEGAMDREAYNEKAQDILARENAAARGQVSTQTHGVANPNPNIKRGGFGVPKSETPASSGIMRGGFGSTAKKIRTPEELHDAEDTVGKGYTGGKADAETSRKQNVLKHFKARWAAGGKKKGLIFGALGGGGLVGGLGLFSITLGPLQFMHISQMLMDHDFSALDDANDDKASRLLRYAFYAKRGQVERTRLGALGNKYADRFEARLQSVGLKTAYTQVFGFKDGYVVDRREPEYRGMDDKQLQKYFKETYGVDLKPGSAFGTSPDLNRSGVFVVDMRPGEISYSANKKFVKVQMQKAGLNKVTSALGTNLLRKRAGITLHPIKKLDAKVLRKLETAFQNWRKERNQRIREGSYRAPGVAEGAREEDSDERRNAAADQAEEGRRTVSEGSAANADITSGDRGALSKFSDTINSKWAAGGIAAITIPCMLRGIAVDANNIKHDQVVLPLMRMGTEAIAVGEQAKSGMDITTEQLGFYNQLANGKVGTGKDAKESTWSDSRVFQTINGAPPEARAGEAPPETLTTINKGTPFDFLNEGAIGSTMDVVCSGVVQGGVLIISFFGGPVSAAIAVLTSPITAHLLGEAAKWLAGSPINIDAVGAEYGSNIAYGSRLASNDQALASGGTIVTQATEKSLDSASKYAADQEFKSKSLAYRLFNPEDYHTPVARLIDSQNVNNSMTNIASLTTNFLNVGSQFGNLTFGFLSGRTSAASGDGYYDYGFPRVAVDPSVYMKKEYNNPYEVADKAADILDSSEGQDYIDKAKRCNGVTIQKDSAGLWNVVSNQNDTPHMDVWKQPECSANGSVAAEQSANKNVAKASSTSSGWASSFSNMANTFGNSFFGLFSKKTSAQSTPQVQAAATDQKWETVTQFVNSTVNMNGMGCKFGDDQACADVGLTGTSSGASNGATPVGVGGDAKSIAALISKNPNITFQTAAGKAAFQQVVDTGAQKDCGTTIPISPVLLSIIQSLADPAKGDGAYKIVLGVFSIGHGCDGGQHGKGTAVDINGVGKGGVTTGNQLHFDALNSAQLGVVKQFYTDFANSFPEKTGGMGQIQCFPGGAPPKRVGVIYFNDACNHLHVDARKN